MWNIKTPPTYLINYIDNFPKEYKLCCILEKEKYESLDNFLKQDLVNVTNISIVDLCLPNPNNLSILKNIVMIKLL